MIKIENNKKYIIVLFGCVASCLIPCLLISIVLIKDGAKPMIVVILSLVEFFPLLLSFRILALGLRKYELSNTGITICSIFRISRHYALDVFPYCYIMWFTSPKTVPYPMIVFSRTEIDHKQARKIGKRGYFISKPYSVIVFQHTKELEKEIRCAFPELKIEYRNTFLASKIIQ